MKFVFILLSSPAIVAGVVWQMYADSFIAGRTLYNMMWKASE